jgi:hypothetical protein
VSEVLWPEARKEGEGTEFVNGHPIVTLFLDKLCSLNGGHYNLNQDYSDVLRAVEKLAESEVQS